MQFTRIVIACLIAAGVASIAIALLLRLASPLGLVDRPDHRKLHIGQVPLIGGLAVFVGVLVAALWLGSHSHFIQILLGTTTVVALLGVIDDRHNLSVRVRVLVQAAAILTVVLSTGVQVRTLGHFLGHELHLGWASIPFTVMAVIGLINAFNLMDGIDGLAGLLALVGIAAMALLIDTGRNHRPVALMVMLAASLLPYLACNLGLVGRKIFLGDAGSMVLGYLIAWAMIRLSQQPGTGLAPADVLWCVALPVLDTIAVMYRRLRAGHSPFKPDRGHIHHILMNAGFSPRAALACLVAIATAMALLGRLAREFGETTSLLAFALLLAVYVLGINRIWWRQRARLARPVIQLAANDAYHGATDPGTPVRARLLELPSPQADRRIG